MPEAFAVLLVGVVSLGIFIYAKVQGLDSQSRGVADERERVLREIDWLEQRLDMAERENWHDDMREPIEERLAEARRRSVILSSR